MIPNSSLFISVIIPAYNRAHMIGLTLKSFIDQQYPPDRFEIIVVDNNSTDNTKDVVLGIASTSRIAVRYLHEPRQGVHYARNVAAVHARGEILYYTDDDMLAEPSLLSEVIMPFNLDAKVATVTGRVLPRWEVPPPRWILEFCSNWMLSLNNPKEDLVISSYDCGIYSCHQAIRKCVLFEAGGFNPENTKGEWIGDGETGLNIKLFDLGYKFAYNGNSVIHHMIPPSRMTQRYLNKRLANQGNCDCYTEYRLHRFSRVNLARRLLGYSSSYLKMAMRGGIKFVIGRPTWRLDLAKTFYYRNRIRYDYRLIRDEKWRELVLRYNWINEELGSSGSIADSGSDRMCD
jgi:glycosyltransferase involved in cell wall biosynthesis